MVGFLCATPYHIIAAMNMAAGVFSQEKSTLIVMDHFAVDETLLEGLRSSGIFSEVLLYRSNNKTKLNNLKRLYNAFFEPEIIKDIAKRDFSHFVFLALDFIDATYIIDRLKKRGAECEFAFGDDGVGSYVSAGLYRPKTVSRLILTLNGRKKLLDEIKTLYLYNPSFAVENTRFELKEITRNNDTDDRVCSAIKAVWPCDLGNELEGKILYFEQPYSLDPDGGFVKDEIEKLGTAATVLEKSAVVKMHPRSAAKHLWENTQKLETDVPFEALLLQNDVLPDVLMSHSSTALFSSFLMMKDAGNCTAVMLAQLLDVPQMNHLKEPFEKLRLRIIENFENVHFYCPKTKKEYIEVLKKIKALNKQER